MNQSHFKRQIVLPVSGTVWLWCLLQVQCSTTGVIMAGNISPWVKSVVTEKGSDCKEVHWITPYDSLWTTLRQCLNHTFYVWSLIFEAQSVAGYIDMWITVISYIKKKFWYLNRCCEWHGSSIFFITLVFYTISRLSKVVFFSVNVSRVLSNGICYNSICYNSGNYQLLLKLLTSHSVFIS